MKKHRIRLIGIIVVPISLLYAVSFAEQGIKPPIPVGEQVVLLMRVSQVAQDRDLRNLLLQNNAVSNYLKLLNLKLSDIDGLTLFMPFDKNWFAGRGIYIPPTLPKNGAFIITGDFDPKAEFRGVKSKGWKEEKYSNKKVLWWSTGTSYYQNPKNGECLGQIPGDGLVVAGSAECIQNIYDVAGGKTPGFDDNSAYDLIYRNFNNDNTKLVSAFIVITPVMRDLIITETAPYLSPTGKSALSYINHLDDSGLSIARRGAGFHLDGYLGMDTESNSMIAAGLLQLGGGLSSLLPPDNPSRSALEDLVVSRQGRMVILQTDMTGQQFLYLLRPHK